MSDRNTVGTGGVGSLFATGTAYISIPKNQDRAQFIKRCFKTQTVFIRGEAGEAFKDVFISKNLLTEVDFPESSDKRGSLVAWIKQPKHNIPIVVGVIDLKTGLSAINKERQIKLQRKNKSGNLVDIDGSADDASLEFSVSSAEDGKGSLRIKVSNPDQTAKAEVYVSGDVDIFADKKVRIASNDEIFIELVKKDGSSLATLSYKSGVGFALKDEYKNEIVTKDKSIYLKEGSGTREFEVSDTKINLGKIGGAAEPGVLGDKNETAHKDVAGMIQKVIQLLTQIASGDVAGTTILASMGITLSYPTLMGSTATQLATDLATYNTDIPKTKSKKVTTD